MNNCTLLALEFIQITRSVEFTPDSSSLASLSGEASSTQVEKVRQIHLFMQNKPNYSHFSPKNDDYAKKQTQFKPKQSQI